MRVTRKDVPSVVARPSTRRFFGNLLSPDGMR